MSSKIRLGNLEAAVHFELLRTACPDRIAAQMHLRVDECFEQVFDGRWAAFQDGMRRYSFEVSSGAGLQVARWPARALSVYDQSHFNF